MREIIKKYKKNLIIVAVLGFLLYFYIIFKNDVNEITNKIKQVNIYYLLIIFVFLFIYVFFEGLVIYLIAKRKVKGISVLDSFWVNMATQFFNYITPFSTGGQPFQIVYFKARGIKVRDASSIVLLNFITYNIAYILLGIFGLIFKYEFFKNFLKADNYHYLLFIGFGINILVTILAFFLTFSKKFYRILIEGIWLKIIRWPFLRRFKFERKVENLKNSIEIFHSELKKLKYDKRLWIETILLHIIRLVCFFLVPLFTFMALGENVANNEFNIFVGAIFIAIVMSYVPTPGASGGAEGVFYILFSFLKIAIIPALLLWRFLTYYLYLILGFIALLTLNYRNNLSKLNYDNIDIDKE